ncbi:MAG: PKD domain-containing protein [Bacteroidota bacterium]
MIRIITTLLFFALPTVLIQAQPTININIENPICRNSGLGITNSSINATTYEWDFCINDFDSSPTINSAEVLSGLSFGSSLKLLEANNNWYGFVTSFLTDRILRLDFGNSLNNTPAVVDLGDFSSSGIDTPEGIDVVEVNGNWFGFVGYANNNIGIVRLDFGNSITNLPSATNIGTFGETRGYRDLKVVKQNDDLILVLLNAAEEFVVVNYRNSFLNDPTGFITKSPVTGGSFTTSFDLVNSGGNWVALVSSLVVDQIQQLNFGSDINSPPTVEATYPFSSLFNASKVSLIEEGGLYYLAVANQGANSVTFYDFQDLNPVNAPVELDNTGYPRLVSVELVNFEGKGHLFGLNTTSLFENVYRADCGQSIEFSIDAEPQNISYANSGSHNVVLSATDAMGNEVSEVFTLNVIDNTAPDINFSSSNVCANNSIFFTSANVSGDINSYSWDFGDGAISTDENPTHTFSTSGSFDVTLDVVSTAGCTNRITQSVTIFDPPAPSFDLPGGLICTGSPQIFTNTTVDNQGGNITYQWQVNGNTVSLDEDLEFTFTTGGSQDIRLIASIPGCSTEIMQTIANVEIGPVADFSFNNDCQSNAIPFTDLSTGSVVSHFWDFGNGVNSTLQNPEYQYPEPGDYDVSLTVTGANGCETTITQPITIFALPEVAFAAGLACDGAATQFFDQTIVDGGNILLWRWDFGDPGSASNISTLANPTHIYDTPGDYTVKLRITTNFGCIDSLERTVTVLESPTADFEFDQSCLNEITRFTDASDGNSGGSLTSFFWDINGSVFFNPQVQFTFTEVGDFDVSLTVTSQNLCTSTVTRTLTVAPPPEVDFGSEGICQNEEIRFFDLTDEMANVTDRTWSFAGQGSAQDSLALFQFASAGQFDVNLSVVTASGCVADTTKSITIEEIPMAAFTPSADFGAPPFEVTFENSSSDATNFSWVFGDGDNSTSEEESPTFTYQEVGIYDVQLIAIDENACADTLIRTVEALEPIVDVELRQINQIEQNGETQLILTVANNGTVRVDSLDAIIDLGGNISLRERFFQTIQAGEVLNFSLNFGIQNNLRTDFVCLELVSNTGEITEENVEDNFKCITFSSLASIGEPFPNPSTEQLNLSMVLPELGDVNITLADAQGNIVLTETRSNVAAGKLDLIFETVKLRQGIYLLKVDYQDQSEVFKVIIN